uniref:Uncharacterized protein n=1 Tax=Candidatus Kentrum sp. FW TaxID=2126338 RepID=A0A450S028_9GAMM|nr:MAG: hypothetical protein BECKFW1821A_GA0114235_100861 [Candidatus Kentron sp. FW]
MCASVITDCDTAPIFELDKHVFDFMALFIIPNPENPEPKRSMRYQFLKLSNFLIVSLRIFRESDYLFPARLCKQIKF